MSSERRREKWRREQKCDIIQEKSTTRDGMFLLLASILHAIRI